LFGEISWRLMIFFGGIMVKYTGKMVLEDLEDIRRFVEGKVG